MLGLLQDIRMRTPDENVWLGDAEARALSARMAGLDRRTPAVEFADLSFRLGLAELRLGNEPEGIKYLLEAYRLLPEIRHQVTPTRYNEMIFQLGVAYMRLGETQNCCLHRTAESCILPIRGGGVHTDVEGSKSAIRYFSEVLQNTPPNSPMHLRARWLLNISHMTLGTYPGELPVTYRIPPEAFRPDQPFRRFVEIARGLGVDTPSLSGGAIADDFDGDGYLDLIVSTWDPSGQIRVFRNGQDGTFQDRTRESGLAGIFGGLNLVQADYDNDGDLDVLVLRGAWLGASGKHPNSLLRNNGDFTFTDVTFAARLDVGHRPTQTASWADYDHDGDLDLYVGNESTPELVAPSQLFRNNGDGTFTDVARQAGVTNDRWAKAVAWGDYDDDRYPDLYVSNFGDRNRLYHNEGDGTFTDVAPELNVTGPISSFPAWFWDFDNDGVLDLFVSAYHNDIAHLAASYLGLPFDAELPHLYRGHENGSFENVAGRFNLDRPVAAMGANFGDLDNDGYLDLYLGTGNTKYEDLMPNVLYRNVAGQGFADVTTDAGLGHLQKGHGIAIADFDHDGDVDIFEQMGGAVPGDRFADALYENPGFGNRWITIKLVGVESNRSAIGARIRIEVTENGQRRVVYRHVNAGGSFGANPLRQTIGLGRATRIERLEVFWPTTGRAQAFSDVPLDRHIEIEEDQDRYSIREYRSFAMPAPPG